MVYWKKLGRSSPYIEGGQEASNTPFTIAFVSLASLEKYMPSP